MTVTTYQQHVATRDDKYYKTTLFRSERLLVGLNCLQPGQSQAVHAHADQDKFYLVMEGEGRFVVGDDTHDASPGTVVWAAAGVPHGVTNTGDAVLVVFMGIAPAP